MGMSASQARFLCLTARKSNIEFEGQQINQQRLTLSDTSAGYYSELCNLVVPTPPSVDDYTKVTYTFDDGSLTNTVTSMIARGNNEYSVSYIQQWQDDYSVVSSSSSIIGKTINEETGDVSYKVGSAVLRELGTTENYNISADPYLGSLSEDQLKDLQEEEKYYQVMLNETVLNNGNSNNKWYIRYVKDSSTGSYVPYFYQKNEVENESNYNEGYSTSNINCYTIGSATKTKEVLNVPGTVEKDSTGRYISLLLYQTDTNGNYLSTNGYIIDKDGYEVDTDGYKISTSGNRIGKDGYEIDEKGNPIYANVDTGERLKGTPVKGFRVTTEYALTTNTLTDEDAYNDAMNQYNYKQYQYDKRVQEINAKIEVVQQQDKSLELELKQLDTAESAINNELDAVKKVLSKNIDSGFKTFNA